MPTVSIVIPCYNEVATLEALVDSVLAAPVERKEVILVDDGSTDGARLIAEAAAAHPQVTLAGGDGNRGLPTRLNQIAALARGEYLARMDADDMMHPVRLERQVGVLRGRPEVDVVGTAMFIMRHDGRLLGISQRSRPADPAFRLRKVALQHPTVVASTSWFRAHPYDESLGRVQDMELWVRAGPSSVLVAIDEPLHFWRQDPEVIPAAKHARADATQIAILREHGPAIVGRARTELLVLRTRAKAQLYRVLRAIGRPELADRIRYRPLRAVDRREGEAALARIQATPRLRAGA